MDYKKSYTLLWVGLIAGFVLMPSTPMTVLPVIPPISITRMPPMPNIRISQ